MPYLRLEINRSLSDGQCDSLAKKAAALIAEGLKKNIDYVQTSVSVPNAMTFGSNSKPTVFAELRSLGFPDGSIQTLSKRLTELVVAETDVPPKRVFLNFIDMPRSHWAWNEMPFG